MERRERGDRVAEIALLDQPLRRALYDLVAGENDWVGRDEAAQALGLDRSVAAFHLDKLAEGGLLDVAFARPPGRGGPGAGRPAKRYRRSEREVSVSLPDRRYELAGAVLADAVTEATATGRPVDAALADVAFRTGRELGSAAAADSPPAAAENVVPAAVDALRRLGYEPRIEDGDVVLVNCPFHGLAERHRGLVCGMNLDLLAGFVEGIQAEARLKPRLHPAADACCVRLSVT